MLGSRLLRADLTLVLITLIWGASFAIVKLSLAQVSPILFISLRFWVGTLVCIACVPTALRGITLETLRRSSVLALLLLGGFIFQTLGLRGTTASRSAFITSLAVLLVPLLGFMLFGRRPRARTLAGVVVAVVGLGMITLDTIPIGLTWGDVLTLICALVFALHILFLGRYLPTSDYRQLAVLQLAGSALICSILLPMLETPFIVWDYRFVFSFLFIGIFATGLAFFLQNRAQQWTTANRTALIFSLEPLFASVFAYLLLDQSLSGKGMVGGALIIAGILFSELKRGTSPDAPVMQS